MNIEQMARQIMDIESSIMFSREQHDYTELLEAVEELRYFLLYDVGVRPPVIEIIPSDETEYIF